MKGRTMAIHTQSGTAKDFLAEYLRGKGAVPSSEVIEAGRAAGLSRSAIQRGRLRLQIDVRYTQTAPTSTTWELLT